MFVVDTNVLVHAVNPASPDHRACRDKLELWRGQAAAWFLSWGIVYEFLRVVTHERVFDRPLSLADAWRVVDALLASPGIGLLVETDRHASVAREVARDLPHLRGSVVHDVHIATLMREHGVSVIYTLDADFGRMPFLDVRDPRQG